MIRFYAPDIETSLTLPESDSGHCVRVLRMREGDELEAVDGRGYLYRCRLADADPRRAAVEIIASEKMPRVWPADITVAVAPTKNSDRIVPLQCRHSERKNINTDRLRKIAVAAMKQSLKAILPQIDEMTPFARYIAEEKSAGRFIAYCDPTIPRRLLARQYVPGQPTAILVGPEGDFDPTEIRLALDSGWQPVTLGDNRLRTETAALVACDTCHIINQLKLQ